jgi:hypothetical protein
VQAATFVQDLVPLGTNLPAFLDLTDVSVAQIYLPDTSLTWPEFELNYQDIHDMLDEAARECMVIIMNVLGDVQAQAGQQLRGVVQELARCLLDILELKDYNPPTYQGSRDDISTVEAELVFQSKRGEEVRNWTQKALSNLRLEQSDLDWNAMLLKGPNISSKNYSYVDDSTTFQYLGLQFPSFSIPDLVSNSATWLSENTWLVEIFIQIYRLWRLESTYARGAIPDLPSLDYGDGDDDVEQPQTKYMVLAVIMKGLLSPQLVMFVFLCLPICIIAVAFWFPYVHKSCVMTSDGTYFGRNFLSPLLINQANAQGNIQFLHAEFECQKSQRQWCTEIGTEAQRRFQSDQSAFLSFQVQQNQSRDALWLLEDCLDISEITPLIKMSCCGLKGHGSTGCLVGHNLTCPIDPSVSPPRAFQPLGALIAENSCKDHIFEWALGDARYDCANLVQVCRHIPCAGVNKDLIRFHTIQADCQVELYAIDCCYFLLAVFFHAVAVNVICTLFFNGLRHIYWRKLCPNGIRLRTQLCENGDLAKGFELKDRLGRIAEAIWRFELMGKIKLVLGVTLFLAYVITTSVLVSRN